MDQKTVIYIVRHGESEYNVTDKVSGHGDPAITEKGISQARATKDDLSHIEFHQVYSSDLKRAIKTAEIVTGRSVAKHRQSKNLREKNYGSLEGGSGHLLEPDRQARLALPKAESWDYKHVPDMESDHELADRLIAEIKTIAKGHPGEAILIGCHGTAIRVIIMRLQDKHYNEMPYRAIKNGGYIKLTYSKGEFVIDEINGYN